MDGTTELLFYVNGRKVSAPRGCPAGPAGPPRCWSAAQAPGPGLHAGLPARRGRERMRLKGLPGSLGSAFLMFLSPLFPRRTVSTAPHPINRKRNDCPYSAESALPNLASVRPTPKRERLSLGLSSWVCLDEQRAVWSQDRTTEMNSLRPLTPIVSKVTASSWQHWADTLLWGLEGP